MPWSGSEFAGSVRVDFAPGCARRSGCWQGGEFLQKLRSVWKEDCEKATCSRLSWRVPGLWYTACLPALGPLLTRRTSCLLVCSFPVFSYSSVNYERSTDELIRVNPCSVLFFSYLRAQKGCTHVNEVSPTALCRVGLSCALQLRVEDDAQRN